MKPHYKIIIVAENATDLKAKAQELAQEFKSTSACEEKFDAIPETPKTFNSLKESIREVNQQVNQVVANAQAIAEAQVEEDDSLVSIAAASGDTDSRGIKWDARIHLSNKKQKADGTWMYKRNLDENLKVKVEAELLSGLVNTPPAPLTNVTITPPVVPQTDVHPAVAARNARLTAVPSTPAQPVAAAMPAPNFTQHPNETGYNFESFKQNLPAIIAGLLRKNIQGFDQGYIQALADHFGVANLWEVVKMDQHCHVLFEEFKRQGFVKGI